MALERSYHQDDMLAAFTRLKAIAQRASFPTADERRQCLKRLEAALLRSEASLLSALQKDFGHRAHEESRLLELIPVLGEIKHAKRHLKTWMRPSKRRLHISTLPAKAKVIYQPKGVVGVISPWNYPVLLCLGPLIGALAAGNRVMLKVSEYCPETNKVLREILDRALGENWIEMVEGEADLANRFSLLPFDHLLFTGSTSVGRIVMRNAAENLTPVTLELGGKSPLLVAPSADLSDTAKKLVFGKMLNAGQTCVAPDYIMCHADQKQTLIEYIKQELLAYYPEGVLSPDYTSLINPRQLDRLQGYLEEAGAAGIECDNLMSQGPAQSDGKLALHVIHQPTDDLRVMQDELFGPLLPILLYSDLEEALSYIHQRPRPLALYLFTQQTEDQRLCEARIVSGSLVINHTLVQVAQADLPFGGIGASGMGAYHAEEGFRTFSHGKSVLSKRGKNILALLRPPYRRPIHRFMAKFWRFL
ncbi:MULTISPECIES: coniferyl aldehyde dehydrogenase [Marinomonas]|uniref:Aldehyde dehydrogenase n=1 Tax=Marinomonas arctica TaxID=383750 RepID=A0A7H1J6S8_9GAMM|nr:MULTISPECIES: coniferyl aldehyde dehydrogenase [Marinomonas]MCS7485220.1 coniferyl aldehyde dehydrogenase [Marinomonas sp. BSi20414]QNT06194.1 coniferyl aldehyde dehydrogenase [Marinomonas arctica]GGN18121.1 aldehyde dehydrogenase [Marinomonas arctica]